MKFFLFVMIFFSNVSIAGDFHHLEKGFYWKDTPTVFLCDRTSIDPEVVKKAISFWIDSGYRLNPVPEYKNCKEEPRQGEIRIDYLRNSSDNLNPSTHNGVSETYNFSNTKMYYCAELWINKELQEHVEIFKHELGHAVGLKDEYNNHASVMTHRKNY